MTTPDDLAALLVRIAQRHDVPHAVLLAIAAPAVKAADAAVLGGLEARLMRRVSDIKALRRHLAEPTVEPALARWKTAASAALDAGRFVDVDKALAQAERQILGGSSNLSELPNDRRIAAGEARADRGLTSQLNLGPAACREAARRFAEAAAIIGLADSVRSHALALLQADALMRWGGESRDRAGYDEAIAHLRIVLGGLDNFDHTLLWAATQERLGLALTALADLVGDEASAIEAATCYRQALEDLRREKEPLLWMRLQRHLGTLALRLGKDGEHPALMEEAVDALRAALSATDHEADPQGAAQTQFDLGRALFMTKRRSKDMAGLESAFHAFEAAARHWTREANPDAWSDIQDRMASVLVAMGESYSEPVVLEEAVAAFGRALELRPRERMPQAWASSSANQGEAMMLLASRRKDMALAQQALTQIVAAVETARISGAKALVAKLQPKLIAASAIAQTLSRR